MFNVKFKWTLLLLILLICINCFADGVEIHKDDYFIFWQCGSAAKLRKYPIYCLKATTYSIDSSNTQCFHPQSLKDLTLNALTDNDFKKALNLFRMIPTELLNKNSGTWGKRLTDASTLYIIAHLNDQDYKWQIKADIDQCSKPIQDFIYQLFMIMN